MHCFAVVNFTAFESNHTADTGLSIEFLTTQSGQSKRDILIHDVLISFRAQRFQTLITSIFDCLFVQN